MSESGCFRSVRSCPTNQGNFTPGGKTIRGDVEVACAVLLLVAVIPTSKCPGMPLTGSISVEVSKVPGIYSDLKLMVAMGASAPESKNSSSRASEVVVRK